MSTVSSETNIEPRWQTYLRAIIFALPAVIAWGFAVVLLVPKLKEICSDACLDASKVGWLWDAPMFLVEFCRSIGVALILSFVLLELVGRGWARHRRVTVSIVVWLTNVTVLVGLTAFLILLLLAAPALSHAK